MSYSNEKKLSFESDLGFNYFKDILPESISTTKDLFDEQATLQDDSSNFFFAKVRIEKKGRGGKVVTVFYDCELNYNHNLKKISQEIKKSLGIGGKVIDTKIELNGDVRKRVAHYLSQRFNTKILGLPKS